MFLDASVIGRALEGDVHGQLHAGGLGRGDEVVEVGERAELGMDGVWPPSSEPMAQGLPSSSGPAVTLLFGPLRKALPMGWMGGR